MALWRSSFIKIASHHRLDVPVGKILLNTCKSSLCTMMQPFYSKKSLADNIPRMIEQTHLLCCLICWRKKIDASSNKVIFFYSQKTIFFHHHVFNFAFSSGSSAQLSHMCARRTQKKFNLRED